MVKMVGNCLHPSRVDPLIEISVIAIRHPPGELQKRGGPHGIHHFPFIGTISQKGHNALY